MLLVSTIAVIEKSTSSRICEANIESTGFDDDIQRRDSLHALINSLPDAHYATLRAIILV